LKPVEILSTGLLMETSLARVTTTDKAARHPVER
jgi:hypothetical protein